MPAGMNSAKVQSMSRLLQFAASQENVDRVARWSALTALVLGVPVAIATIVAMIAK